MEIICRKSTEEIIQLLHVTRGAEHWVQNFLGVAHMQKREVEGVAASKLGQGRTCIGNPSARVSSETCFVSKQPKLEPKLVSALSETRRLFRLFRCNIKTGSFGVSKLPKQTKDQPKQQQICSNINLFISPSHKFCLFRLFRYRSETPKQTEKNFVWFHGKNKPKNKRNRLSFDSFRFEPKTKLIL